MDARTLFNSTIDVFEKQNIDFRLDRVDVSTLSSSRTSSSSPTSSSTFNNDDLSTVICVLKYANIPPTGTTAPTGIISSASNLSSYYVNIPSTSVNSFISHNWPPSGYFGQQRISTTSLGNRNDFIDCFNSSLRAATTIKWNDIYVQITGFCSTHEDDITGSYHSVGISTLLIR